MTHPAISAAAQHVAVCVAQHQRASEGLAQAEAALGTVAERLAALDRDRDAIIARHRAGTGKPDDAGRIALLDADRADLAVMLRDEDAAVAAASAPVHAASAPVHAASAELKLARQNFQRAEDELAEGALIEHVSRLDGLMAETLRHLGEVGTRLGRGKAAWGPSAELWGGLRKIQAGRGLL